MFILVLPTSVEWCATVLNCLNHHSQLVQSVQLSAALHIFAQDINSRSNLRANFLNVIVPCQPPIKVHSKELNEICFFQKEIAQHHRGSELLSLLLPKAKMYDV
ncbi:hypothetical protein J6590_085113 [Homalodisca vitripennis]|nr:hypothetical protein J6590_085113 [Homalodisca vitripennis]